MRVLFIYGEEKVKFDNKNNIYTNGTITTDSWNDRYKLLGNVTFLARRDDKQYSEEEAHKKFAVIDKDVNYVKLNNNKDSLKNYFSKSIKEKNKKTIEKYVKESDYIIARIPSDYSYLAIDYAIKYNKKYLVEVVGCAWDGMWNHGIKGKILALPSYMTLKKYTKNAPFLVYVTNQFLQNRYPSKGKQICCSNVVLENTDELVLKNRLSKISNIKKDSKIILGTCGGIDVREKGHINVLKALEILKSQGYTNYEYQMVGNGDKTRLESKAKELGIFDEVKFIGSLKHEKVFEWLDSIDIYIQPSNQEGLCRSIIEAESRACPVIASNAGGNPELINNKYIFKKKNIKELVNRIKKMTKEEMIIESEKNYNNSKQYNKELLNKRRKDFFLDFKNEIR